MMLFVHGIPVVLGLVMSFFEFPSLVYTEWFRPETFIGISHYVKVFQPDTIYGAQFWNSLKVTVLYTVGTVVGVYTLGLIAALALNTDFRGRLAARTAILVPYVAPVVATYLTWQMMFRTDTGIINAVLREVGLIEDSLFWLLGPNSLFAIIIANVWRNFPYAAIMLYAGLQSIPEQLYEAAEVDGAGWWGKFRYVTLPQLKPVSAVILLLLVLWTFVNFTTPYVILGGSPSDSGNVLMLLIYNFGFSQSNYGIGAALSVMLFLFSMSIAYIYYKRVVASSYDGGAI
ncbi:carbohydrate ABC transporter permease [Halorhabdus rudnickae]|uniref:carbohydrate ABC transporter permease n=1 Tax=Halorhabdus rudnickae TaxID=1775544 RepID=UPI001083D67C